MNDKIECHNRHIWNFRDAISRAVSQRPIELGHALIRKRIQNGLPLVVGATAESGLDLLREPLSADVTVGESHGPVIVGLQNWSGLVIPHYVRTIMTYNFTIFYSSIFLGGGYMYTWAI